MSDSITQTRIQARRAVHARFAVPATYLAPVNGAQERAVTVRRQTRSVVNGKGDGAGYAMLQEGYARLVFNGEELQANSIALLRNGVIRLAGESMSYTLFNREPTDGPVNVSWIATEERDSG